MADKKKALDAKEVREIIKNGAIDSHKSQARVGLRYYNGHHDIESLRLFYYDEDGNPIEDKHRSNIKISHPFFRELADQEVQYLLSGTKTIVKSEDQEVQAVLDRCLNKNDEFMSELARVVTGAVVKGCEYMHLYIGADEKIHFQQANSLGVYEVSAKHASDGQAHIIYSYTDEVRDKDGMLKSIARAQDWTADSVTYYVGEKADKLELDEDMAVNPEPHVLYRANDEFRGESLGGIPFIRLDYNDERKSGLASIKLLIDDYDLMSCGLSNNIQDSAETYWCVTGFEGELNELIHNIKMKHVVNPPEGGTVKQEVISIPTEARSAKMTFDERNIYRFGMGFNAETVGGGALTATEIKSRYSLLDMKTNKLEMQLRPFIAKIVEFVASWLRKQGLELPPVEELEISFTRSMIVNEADRAQTEKVEAEKVGAEVNMLMGLIPVLGAEVVIPEICKKVGLSYDEVKDMLPALEGTGDDLA